MIELLRAMAEGRGTTESPAPSLFDLMRLQAMVYEESKRAHDLLFAHLLGARRGPPPDGGEDELAELLRRVQLVLLQHPVAAQAAFRALMAEGRRFAATPEGAAWKAALAGSDVVRRAPRLWDAVSMSLLEDDAATVVPSAYLEALFRAVKSSDLEGLLGKLGETPHGGEHGDPR